MNTQAIKIIDNLLEEVQQYIDASKRDKTPQWTTVYEMQYSIIEEAKKRISSLPSIDIDSLQRYEATEYPWIDWYYIEENDNWEYVRYQSLIDLLQDTLELNQ